MDKSTKIIGAIGLLVIVFLMWYLHPFRAGKIPLQGRRIALYEPVYQPEDISDDRIIFCGNSPVNTRNITYEVVRLLEKKLSYAGAMIDTGYDLEDLTYYLSLSKIPNDFVLGISHTDDLDNFFDESGDSYLSRYIHNGVLYDDSREAQLAYEVQKELNKKLGNTADVALTLNMGILDEGYDGDGYKPVRVTVRPFSADTEEIACDYIGKQKIIKKEVDAIFRGIVNYYK